MQLLVLVLQVHLGPVPSLASSWWRGSRVESQTDEQMQTAAWAELRRQQPVVQLDESVLLLFDREAGEARVDRWRGELGLPTRRRTSAMDQTVPVARTSFLYEDFDGTGWDFWQGGVKAGQGTSLHQDEPPPPEFSKGATDRRSMETLALYQRLQAQAIAERSWRHKPSVTLIRATELAGSGDACAQTASVWSISCNEGLTAEMYHGAYGVIPGCSPQRGPCDRRVLDGFATPVECAQLIAATNSAMQFLFHQGDQTSLAPASSAERLGMRGSLLFRYLLLKTRLQIMKDYNLDALYDSGALLTRISHGMPNDEWEMDPGHAYWNPHVDKANIAT